VRLGRLLSHSTVNRYTEMSNSAPPSAAVLGQAVGPILVAMVRVLTVAVLCCWE
jgi:hypothetical protein